MARSLLAALVRGTRQMLTAQLIASVGAVALAGWTLAITSDVIRERDQLRERVIQLETAMGAQGIVVPAKPATVDQSPANRDDNGYPPAIGGIASVQVEQVQMVSASRPAPAAAATGGFNPARVLQEIFTPPPPVRALVIHARGAADAALADQVARDLRDGNVGVIVDVLPAHDQRPSGYAYFDGRQSLAAASVVSRFNDAARRAEIAPWSAQVPGVALPAQGEYSADRVDIVLPPLPAPAPPPAPASATAASTPPPTQ
jgi:hypothetical protein